MNQWLVYQGEGAHVGPVPTDLLVRGIAAGRVPKDAHIAKAGSAEWKPLMTIPEIASALEALGDQEAPPGSIGLAPILEAPAPPAAPEPPMSEADATEVHRRDEAMKLALSRPVSVAPPKPPSPPTRSTNPPALRPSGSMAIAPSRSVIPAAVPVAPPPVVPPPPNTVKTLPPEQPAVRPSLPPPPPPPLVALATPAASAPPAAEPTKDEAKKPAVDPKLAMLLPLGIFGVFVVLSLFVVVYALVFKPKPVSAETSSEVTRP